MSIKSDKWITEMSKTQSMIEPFSENQIRLDKEGKKLISYGVSSYGYDVRCSNEFKVFTNIHSAVVDPKSFDEKSFVDIESDICVIPPNSFALARTAVLANAKEFGGMTHISDSISTKLFSSKDFGSTTAE